MSTNTKPVVYLVDDDKSIRDSMRLLLKSSGILLVSYARAEEFLEALPANPSAACSSTSACRAWMAWS